jgi:WD40 repeat protein
MRWLAVGLCVGAVVGCGGANRLQSIAIGQGADAGRDSIGSASDASPQDARGPDAGGPPVVTSRDGGAPDASVDGGPRDGATPQMLCPPLDAPPATAPSGKPVWGTPTKLPFSCDPLPSSFIFAPPAPDTPGLYARCASFAEASAESLAINADGSRVALIGTDGIARIVDVASRMVVGALAPPRASIGRAAFSAAGDAILTVAPGERQATLWRADTFAPVWTTVLPGHAYQGPYEGAAAFSPDGASVLVSTGMGLYLLDAATGAIRVTSDVQGAILSAVYGWSGRRIAVEHAPLTGMCIYSPHGGSVTLLDPTTLNAIATVTMWPLTGDESPDPGRMAVAADADLLVTSDDGYPQPHLSAFRLSDGGSLPAPLLTGSPLLLSPDGTAGLIADSSGLRLERIADGALVASTMAAAPRAAAMSADGSAIAAGSNGAGLLAVWRPADGSWTPTCSAAQPTTPVTEVTTSLDATGSTVAVAWGTEIRVFRRTDGALLSTIDDAHQPAYKVTLSPDGGYVLGEFTDASRTGALQVAVLRTSDGVQVADLGTTSSYQGGFWEGFWFLPNDKRLDGALVHTRSPSLIQVDLEGGAVTPGPPVDGQIEGFSGECPLVLGANSTLYRECGGCQPLPLATDTLGGIVSADGRAYVTEGNANGPQPTVVWSITSPPALIRTYPPRSEEASWDVSETPLAISADGSRVITTAQRRYPCPTFSPGFTVRVHDVAADATIDELPPYMRAFSGNLNVLSYGTVLWCAR